MISSEQSQTNDDTANNNWYSIT